MGGAAPRLGSVTLLRVRLDTPALKAIQTLKAREASRAAAAGERYIGYQVSRLIREAIQIFATRDFPVPVRTLNSDIAVTFHSDAETLAVIDYHARRRFDGNRAATVRAMLAAAVAPAAPVTDPGRAVRPYQGYASPANAHRLAWEDIESGDEPSRFEDPQYHWEKRRQARREEARAEAQRQAIEREAKENRRMRRKKFWEYSPVYQQNKAKAERNREGIE
jgi:hypothetical protein